MLVATALGAHIVATLARCGISCLRCLQFDERRRVRALDADNGLRYTIWQLSVGVHPGAAAMVGKRELIYLGGRNE